MNRSDDPAVCDGLVGLREPSDAFEARLHRAEVRRRLFGEDARGTQRDNRIDRYEIVRRIGRGGGGVVYEALDPRVGRSVALKLVGRLPSVESECGFLREAMTLARLSHPNVVAVYDAGLCPAGAYLVMELVDGPTLADWLESDRPRPWRKVVEAFAAAGDGLAACHREGLVHADFKPGNVAWTPSGEVKLLDFGLARGIEAGAQRLLGGTPPYMAPEQHRGEALDERSDVYSLCVALYRGLFGVLPFSGDTPAAQLRAKQTTIPRPPRAGRRVPAAVRRIVLQGLAPEPDARPSSVEVVTRVLRAALGRRLEIVRRASVVSLLLAAGVSTWWVASQRRPLACTGADDAWATVYDPLERARVLRAVEATELPYASTTAEHVVSTLDRYGERWRDQWRAVCEATGDAAARDAGVACLIEQRRDFAATLARLGAPDAKTVENADTLVRALPDPDACAHAQLAEQPPPPAVLADAVARLSDDLARARAAAAGGHPDEAWSIADAAVREATEIGYAPLEARATLVRANAHQAKGDQVRAAQDGRRALRLGLATRNSPLALRAAIHLIAVEMTIDVADNSANVFVETAQGLLVHGNPADEANLLNILGLRHWRLGELEQAAQTLRRSAELRDEGASVSMPSAAVPLTNLSMVLAKLGRYEPAQHAAEEAVEILVRTRGESHPSTATTRNALGTVLRARGRYRDALAQFERVLETRTATLGVEHPGVLGARLNIVWVRRDIEGAEALADTYIELIAEMQRHPQLGSDAGSVAFSRSLLGDVLLEAGRLSEAEVELRWAVDALAHAYSPTHPNVAVARVRLARLLVTDGRVDEAEPLVVGALEDLLASRPENHDEILDARNTLAAVHSARGDGARARAEYESVARVRDTEGDAKRQVSIARLRLASLRAADGRRREAMDLAAHAVAARVALYGEEHPAVDEARRVLSEIASPTEEVGR